MMYYCKVFNCKIRSTTLMEDDIQYKKEEKKEMENNTCDIGKDL